MTARRHTRRVHATTVQSPAVLPAEPRPRSGARRALLLVFTVLALAAAIATLCFWYYAAVTGALNLTDTSLYFIRNVGLVGLLIGGAGLLFLLDAFRRAALPTANLLEGIQRAAGGDLGVTIDEHGPYEVRVLGRSINGLLGRFRAEAAADLGLQTAVARTLQRTPVDDPRHSRLIADWNRLLALRNHEVTLHPEPVDLGALTQEGLANLHEEASQRGTAIRAVVQAKPFIAEIDPLTFSDILGAVVRSQLGRPGCGTELRVTLFESRKPAGVAVEVIDNGRVPSAAEIESVVSEFRADAPVGSGLEMLLAKKLVELLSGNLLVEPAGQSGLKARFFLPFD